MYSFKEYDEELNEISILKKPITLFALLASYKAKISSADTAEDKIDMLATMLFISGQLNFNLVKGVENRMKNLDKKLEGIL